MKQMVLILYSLFVIMMVFMGVIFITLLERKVLGLIQYRVGPNKVLLKGVVQSLGDAVKLMSKQDFFFFFSSWIEYNFLPVGMMFVMMTLWLVVPSKFWDYNNSFLMVLCILSFGVYPIMYGSWFSGSLYPMLGAVRSIAQMISYEVSMIMVFISFIIYPKTFNMSEIYGANFMMVFGGFIYLIFMLFISFLVELGRSPVDLLEGESELVSGFNTEFFGLKFALIFLAEYGTIMFMGGLMSSLIMGVSYFSVSWCLFTMMFIYFILWIRGILPRIRYDKLMYMCWISMLNLSFGVLVFSLGIILSE